MKTKIRKDMLVVFRLWGGGLVKFGKVIGFNTYDNFQKDAPIVQAHDDDRTYVVETNHPLEHKRGHIRPATKEDIAWFNGERENARLKRKSMESVGTRYLDLNSTTLADVPTKKPLRRTTKNKVGTTSVGKAAADAVMKESKK